MYKKLPLQHPAFIRGPALNPENTVFTIFTKTIMDLVSPPPLPNKKKQNKNKKNVA